MNEKALKVLEYDKIIGLLKAQAGSGMTRDVISELKPFSDPREIETALAETDEAVRLITYKGALPLGNFYDIRESIVLAEKGGTLTIRQLLHILYDIKVATAVKSYMKGDVPELPMIISQTELLETFASLADDLDRSIESEDMLSDNASVDLKNIRRNIVRQNEAIKNRINQIISRSDNQSMLQDSIVTVRDGRYVIPVKQEHRGKFPGIIHDQSSSGATLFIEPQVIVTMNNELRELEAEEKAEVERILAEFSSRVAEGASMLKNNLQIMLHLDFIMAKGKLANIQKAGYPRISADGVLELKKARHPLLDQSKAVPVDIILGEKYNVLVVTGPNTGGKTVTLKTAGLLSLMAQSGLHIPANDGSKIPVYEDVFADIGDEQSIEQSLSTFSSHMKNIVEIVDRASENTLVLLDELGAGTDPTEGAALAISILETLKAKGAKMMATTHYTELKKYALQTEGVENASMEFDVETLSPTYRLSIGIPGKSNAFEISRKLGLSEEIIERSRGLLEGGDIQFEAVLEAIESDRKAAREELEQARIEREEARSLKEEMDKRAERESARREKMINSAKEEARAIIADAKEVSETVREELKELDRLEDRSERNRRMDRSRKMIRDAAGRYKETIRIEENNDPVSLDDIKVGDRVKVLTIGQNGEVIALPDSRGEITVQVGIMKMKCKAENLKLIIDGTRKKKKPKPKTGKSTYAGLYRSKSVSVSPTINVQGQNLDDALANVAKYIDDAFMAHLSEVTIIHGRGEGILKNGIHSMLKKHPQVKSFRKGNFNEGGDGVTVVTLK